MTERQRLSEPPADGSGGLPFGEPSIEHYSNVNEYLSSEELTRIRFVADKLQQTVEQGMEAIPANLVPPDEPEPPAPQEHER